MALKPPSRPLLPVIGFTLPLGWIDWQPRIDGIHRKWLLWRKKQKPNKTNREQGGPSWLQSPRIPCLELARSLRTKRRFIFSAVPLQLIDGATQEDPPECGTVPSNWSSMISPELLFSRRRRSGIIRDPKGLFPRRLLCLDEVWAQTCKSFLFFPPLPDYHLNIYLHLSPLRRDASPLSTRSFFTHLTVESPASRSRTMDRVFITLS